MSSYSDFLRAHTGEKARARRLYWICGTEDLLKEMAWRAIRDLLDVTAMNEEHLHVGEISESEIWASLNQHPVDVRGARLLVIHDAELLRHTELVGEWVAANQRTRNRSATAIFVSGDSEPPENLEAGSNSMLVRCTLPQAAEAREKRAVEIVSEWGVNPVFAKALVKWVGYDLTEARQVCLKLAYLGVDAEVDLLPALVARRGSDTFVEALLGLHKADATLVIEGADASAAIGMLGTHLSALSLIQRYLTNRTPIKSIASQTGLKETYVRHLYEHARLYPRREAIRRTLLLERLDRRLASGVEDGLLEALTAQW